MHKWGHKYAYEQKLKDDMAEANKLSVIQHMKGWEIWPLIGNERETKDRIEPDRTDQDLTGIFVENGDWAVYQYGLSMDLSQVMTDLIKTRFIINRS